MPKIEKKFEPIAEDYNSPFFRNYLFVKGTSNYRAVLGIEGPTMAVFYKGGKIFYYAVMSTWRKAHNDLKQKTQKNYNYIEKLIDLADWNGRRMNAWTQKNIFDADLEKLSDKKLLALYKKYFDLNALEYTYGVALPLIDFQGFALVENAITGYLKSRVSPKDFHSYFSVFTEPLFDSFSQDQESSLLGIIAKYQGNKNWRRDVVEMSFSSLDRKYPKFCADLKRHTRRFAWVYYVYKGPAYNESNFLEFIKEFVNSKVSARVRLLVMREKKLKTKKQREKYLRELKPDPFNKAMLKLAAKLVWAKPRRKDYQSRSYYHIEKLHRELGKRLGASLEQMRSTPIEILEQALISGHQFSKVANEISRVHICVRVGHNKVAVLGGRKAEEFTKKNFKFPSIKTEKNILKSLAGQVAFAGRAQGRVKIINRPQDMGKMKHGDILVSVATTPSIVPAMKKAAAIVTEEGGLTCHASIVSRELEIPCVVGTKIATRVFRDGDIIEVDANRGVVRKV